jgi:hypothetical protein
MEDLDKSRTLGAKDRQKRKQRNIGQNYSESEAGSWVQHMNTKAAEMLKDGKITKEKHDEVVRENQKVYANKMDEIGKKYKKSNDEIDAEMEELAKALVEKGVELLEKATPKNVNKEKYERCVKQVKASGDAKSPWAVCAASLQKAGYKDEEIGEMLYKMGYEDKEDDEELDKSRTLGAKDKQPRKRKDMPEKGSPEWHKLRIARDTVKNPAKALLGGPSVEEAKEHLKEYGISNPEMEKSNQEDEVMDELINQIKSMGREGLKKTIPNLNQEQLKTLKNVLDKAVNLKGFDKEVWGDDNKRPQKAQEPLTDERSNSEEGVDDWDEKIMKEAPAQHRQQGGDGLQGSGEWEGQVIKSIEGKPADQHLEKSELLAKMIERMRERGMDRTKCMEAMKKKGYDIKKADEMWPDENIAMKDNSDNDQKQKMDKVHKANEESAVEEKLEKKLSVEQAVAKIMTDKHEVQDVLKEVDEAKRDDVLKKLREKKKMEKSIVWSNPIEKYLGVKKERGLNCHYNVDSFIEKEQKVIDELRKSKAVYLRELPITESLKKSENNKQKVTVNDLIEKGFDMSKEKFDMATNILKHSEKGAFRVHSFTDKDFCDAMGLSKKEVETILGIKKAESKEKNGQ